MLHSWILIICVIISNIKLTNSQCSSSWGDCDINCDGNPYCRDKTITCPYSRNCLIDCSYSSDRRLLLNERNLLSVYTCSSSSLKGCCGSTINCPANQYCEIDCTKGCNGVTVYATDSNNLLIKNCDSSSSDNYCGNMNIHCPFTGRGGTTKTCTIEGNDEIENSIIYTQEGFNDVYFQSLDTLNTRVYCGKTGIEFSCLVAANGNTCDTGEPTTCSNFILPTPEPTPSPTPAPSPVPTTGTNNPSINPTKFPTKYPTKIPTITPTNNPTISPTNNPSKYPTQLPTNNPTISPITVSPSITPSNIPTNKPTTPAPTLHAHHVNPTMSPSSVSVTVDNDMDEKDSIDNEDNKASINNEDFWQTTVGFDLEVILIAFCALLLMCCICLFICYWCRKEHIFRQIKKENKERSEYLSSPLLHSYKKNINLELQSFDVNHNVENRDGLQVPIKQITMLNDGETDSEDDLELGDMNSGTIGYIMNENDNNNHNEHIEGGGSKDINNQHIIDEIDNINSVAYDGDIIDDINTQITKGQNDINDKQQTQGQNDINGVNTDEFIVNNNDENDNEITPYENNIHILEMNGNENNNQNFQVNNVDSDMSDDNVEITQGFIQ